MDSLTLNSAQSPVAVTDSGLSVTTSLAQAQFQADRCTVYPVPVTLPSQAVFTPPPRTFVFAQMSAADQATVKAQMDFWAAQYATNYGK